jgi:hypothetical protein
MLQYWQWLHLTRHVVLCVTVMIENCTLSYRNKQAVLNPDTIYLYIHIKHCQCLFVAEDKLILILRSEGSFATFHLLLDVTVGGWAFFTRLHEPSSCWGVEEHGAECQIVPWEVSAWAQVWAAATSHCQQRTETSNSFLPICHVTASLPSQHSKSFIFVFGNVYTSRIQDHGFEFVRSTTSWVLAYKCWCIGFLVGLWKAQVAVSH